MANKVDKAKTTEVLRRSNAIVVDDEEPCFRSCMCSQLASTQSAFMVARPA